MASEEPGVFDFVVRVPKSALRGDEVLVPGETTYADFTVPETARCSAAHAQGYKFIHDADEGAQHAFWFTKDRGDELFRNPITVLTDATTKPHPWDDVILRMGFIEDVTQPLNFEVSGSVVEVPRLFERHWQLPGGVYASKMKVEVFLHHGPFPEDMFLLDIPVPTVVSWQMRNAVGRLKCLHPHIRFRETQTSGRVLPDAGTVGNPITLSGHQDFPATNHPNWPTVHVCDEDVRQIRGVRRLVRTSVYSPTVKRIKNAA